MSPAKSSVNGQGHQNDAARLFWGRVVTVVHVVAGAAFMFGVCWAARYNEKAEAMARPILSLELAGIEGLDRSSLSPPAFHLTLAAQVRIPVFLSNKMMRMPVPGCCDDSSSNRRIGGGGSSKLRVSYHGMLLAWGHVPAFCVCGGAATVEAKADAVLLRDEVRALIQSEQHVVGRAQFDVEGEVAELGYLRCKVFLLQGNAMEGSKCPCQVHYYS